MSGPGEIRIHRLPGGESAAVFLVSSNGTLLELELSAAGASPELAAGALAEVDTGETIFLGEIKARQGTRLVVAVEHVTDHRALAGIQKLWSHHSVRRA